ncbi:formimidoylglutamase [Chungangia koreensis]|uniref:Formimidoylglutamase n=1 Tax=Chungangia koreensis TaxID=752657 RepID=A0ABV8X2N1_9LACT
MMKRTVNQKVWTGRIDEPTTLDNLRYHQVVVHNENESEGKTCALLGFECEEGVRRNAGRLGAEKAPDAIRTELAKLPWNFPEGHALYDGGNVVCEGEMLEKAQAELGEEVNQLLSKRMNPIILGGGHETFFGHYLGVRKWIGPEAKLGIINIDAHFDLRSYDQQPSSGTMFKQVLDSDELSSYFVIGIQRFGNTNELFQRAKEMDVSYILEEELELSLTFNKIEEFMERNDYVLFTLCMDVLNAAFAPGVSATSPFGLHPATVRNIIRKIATSPKTLSFDICEVNPSVDENGRTVKLGAYFVNEAIASFFER